MEGSWMESNGERIKRTRLGISRSGVTHSGYASAPSRINLFYFILCKSENIACIYYPSTRIYHEFAFGCCRVFHLRTPSVKFVAMAASSSVSVFTLPRKPGRESSTLSSTILRIM